MSVKVLARRPSLKDFEVFKQAETGGISNANVLSQQVDWKQYLETGVITKEEHGLLCDYDKHSEEDQNNLIVENGSDLARIFAKLLSNVHNEATVNYVLALVDSMLTVDETRRDLWHIARRNSPDLYKPFLRILSRESFHIYATAKACRILALLFTHSIDPEDPDVSEFLLWVITKLEAAKPQEILPVLSSLKQLLKNTLLQSVVVRQGGLKALLVLLRKEAQNTQLIYVTCFCIWLFTFNSTLYKDLLEQDAVSRLVDVLKTVNREKVVRVVFSALKNLLDNDGFNEAMINSGLLKVLSSLEGRKWNDDDLENDIKVVDQTLQKAVAVLSSFERYSAEILSGNLEWSPVHSEKFWRENNLKFENDNFNLIRALISLLDSQDELTLEVACYDLGEFMRFHPEGKRKLIQLSGKTRLMSKMTHASPKVSKQALLAVQKMMVQNWESLNSQQANVAF